MTISAAGERSDLKTIGALFRAGSSTRAVNTMQQDILLPDQVESPTVLLENKGTEVLQGQGALVPVAKKPLPQGSPAMSGEWQSFLAYQPYVRFQDKPGARDQQLGNPAYSYDTAAETQRRDARGSGANPNSLSCWIMALVALNTLVLCFGLWQLRVRGARMMHAHEMAMGELAEVIRLHLLPCFKQSFDATPLTHGPLDAHITQQLYDWSPPGQQPPFSFTAGDAGDVAEKPGLFSTRSTGLGIHAGSVDFLLSPTIWPKSAPQFSSVSTGSLGRSVTLASDQTETPSSAGGKVK
ncbi:hypothetical protein Efla_006268 [Eimeria flavescens]